MSETPKRFNTSRAIAYNQKSTYVPLPLSIVSEFPRLDNPADSEAFVLAVLDAQTRLGFKPHEVDGLLGHQTYMALLKACDPVEDDYVIHSGCRIQLPFRDEYQVIAYDDVRGLDLHPFGKFGVRDGDIEGVCLHWGGLDAQHCFNVFANGARGVSSHFLIGIDPESEEVIIYQTLDLKHRAYHGGWVNNFTVGIDICQAALPQWQHHYDTAGIYDVRKIKNPTSRGPKFVLSLDERLAVATRLFVEDLCKVLDIVMSLPTDHEVTKDPLPYTVFGHHHVNERKIDIACWWDHIFES